MPEFVAVTLSVPEETVADLYAYASTLIGQRPESSSDRTSRTRWGFGREAVRRSYLGGVSDHWRPFLRELARNPDEWVAWPDLCEAIDLTPQQASGMLGAAERRCKGRPPYEKTYEEGMYYFRMPSSVAEVVNELAAD